MKKILILFCFLSILPLFGSIVKQDSIVGMVMSINNDDNLYKIINDKCELQQKEVPKYIKEKDTNLFFITNIKLYGGLYYVTGYYMGSEYNLVYSKRIIMYDSKSIDIEQAYDIIVQMPPKEYVEFIKQSKENSIHYIELMRNDLFKKIKSYEKFGIGILKAIPTNEDYTTGAEFSIINMSKKTIKYITFNFYGENAVEDKVLYRKGHYSTFRKGIGPVESYDTGTWSFESVWMTDIVEYLTLTSIQIQYMDGTSKSVKYNDKMWIDEKYFTDFGTLTDLYNSKEFSEN